MYDETTGQYSDPPCYHDWEPAGPTHYPDMLFFSIAQREGYHKCTVKGNDSWWVSKTNPTLNFVYKNPGFRDLVCLKCGEVRDEKMAWIENTLQRLRNAQAMFDRSEQRRAKAARLYEEATRDRI